MADRQLYAFKKHVFDNPDFPRILTPDSLSMLRTAVRRRRLSEWWHITHHGRGGHFRLVTLCVSGIYDDGETPAFVGTLRITRPFINTRGKADDEWWGDVVKHVGEFVGLEC